MSLSRGLTRALALVTCLTSPVIVQSANQGGRNFRPPAVPLATSDPYFSIWSFSDRLTDDATRHWTGTEQRLGSMVRIDGQAYRLMGAEPARVPPLPQARLEVLPTRTIYVFEGHGVRIALTFMTPLLPQDLDLMSRPVTYLTWVARAVDSKEHSVTLYYDNTAEPVVNSPDQAVTWSREKVSGLITLRMGSQAQAILAKSGDNLRIDWGYLYAATPESKTVHALITGGHAAAEAFRANSPLPEADDARLPRAANDDSPVMAFTLDLGRIGPKPVARHLILAYDDLYSIEYFHRRLRPYWRRNGAEAKDLLTRAARDYASLESRCRNFDRELMADLTRVGGTEYARLAALAYRQSIAANKLAANPDGAPLLFPKENFSNGCMGTVDVLYPQSPVMLLLNPKLARASIVPVLDYAGSRRWPFPFAPHDIGTYPLANGQVYGGRETSEKDQMPVEESANLILMAAVIAKAEGSADFARRYWPLLTKRADYLKEKGLDPENQLCTDDFAGHLAHNANLSLKAIEALGAYAMLCDMKGDHTQARRYRDTAKDFSTQWTRMADDIDHYRLAFDKSRTWSQKYNLVWDRLLGLNLFPPEVARREITFYKSKENRFGLPLDNRKDYTKLDWELWIATLAESPADFQSLISPIYRWANETPTRVPLTDWYDTATGKKVGFQARSVVGGVYIKMLGDSAAWKKWSSRAQH